MKGIGEAPFEVRWNRLVTVFVFWLTQALYSSSNDSSSMPSCLLEIIRRWRVSLQTKVGFPLLEERTKDLLLTLCDILGKAEMYYNSLWLAKKLNKRAGSFLVGIYNRNCWTRVWTPKERKKNKKTLKTQKIIKVPLLSEMCCRVIASELRRDSIDSLVASIENQLPEELIIQIIGQISLLEENCLGFEVWDTWVGMIETLVCWVNVVVTTDIPEDWGTVTTNRLCGPHWGSQTATSLRLLSQNDHLEETIWRAERRTSSHDSSVRKPRLVCSCSNNWLGWWVTEVYNRFEPIVTVLSIVNNKGVLFPESSLKRPVGTPSVVNRVLTKRISRSPSKIDDNGSIRQSSWKTSTCSRKGS